jgi:hypothetical protein
VAANYDALAGEIADDAAAIKTRADDALRELAPILAEREAVVSRFHALIACVVRVEPGMVPWSRLEPVVREAEAVLMQGGEVEPKPKRDPREPVHGVAVPEFTA